MWGANPLRRSRAFLVVLVLLAGALAVIDSAGTPVTADTATVITFEENIPSPGNITSQYCNSATTNKGVKFLEPVRLIEPAVGTMTATHAATNHFIGDEFTEPNIMKISFTADQGFVSVRVGLDQNYNFPVTAYLRAYTSETPSPATQLTAGEDYVLLGSEATTIGHQLYVTSGGTAQPIRSIEIEFGGPDPVNAAFEVIDNLMYPVRGPQCVADTTSPTVEILEPSAGTPFYGSPSGGDVPLTLHLRATDFGTGVAAVLVEYLSSGGTVIESFSVCGGGNAPGCSLPSTTVERHFLSLMPPGTATLRVSALDFAGNSGEASRAVTITPSLVNLWAAGLEITQAVQPWVATNTATRRDAVLDPPTQPYPAIPDSVPLVAGRTTVARFFVGVENTIGGNPLPGLGASLRCYTEPSYTLSCPGPTEVYPEHQPPNTTKTVTVDPGDTLTDQREDATKTLNFVLPDEWTAVGTIHLEASVVAPVPECDGCVDSANTIRMRSIPFREVPNWHLKVRQVLVDRLPIGTATGAEREAAVEYFRRIYPIDESTVMNGFRILPYLSISIMGEGPDCSEFLGDLHSMYEYLLDDYGYKAIWALTDSQTPDWCSGLGRGDGVAVSRGNRASSGAHEIGHALGLLHTGPPADAHGAECAKDGYCDTDWPWPSGGIGVFGFDVFEFEAKDPGNPPSLPHEHDIMSYGGVLDERWISPRNWIRIFNALAGWSFPYPKADAATATSVIEEAPPAPTPHLLVRGHYDSEAMQWELLPIYQVDRLPASSDPLEADLVVELVDGAGAVLAARPIDLPQDEHIDTDDVNVVEVPEASFVRFIEMPPGTSRVLLRQGESVLASRERSDHSPGVGIATPTSAGFDGAIRWSWADGDGDPLVAWVDYRNAPNVPWQPLGIDVDDDRLIVDPVLLPGGSSAQIRVAVSDGFNTTFALSELFAVPDKAPSAEILRPATGDLFESGRRVALRGNAADMEEEALTGTALHWTSSLDGPLGSGGDIEVAGLSPGLHLITLTATDGAGNGGTDAVAVIVLATPVVNRQPTADAGPDRVWSANGTATLDGTGSSDVDGDPLTYHWSVVVAPPGADPHLDDPNAPQPTLVTTISGTYVVELVVHDGQVGSRPDRVVVQRDLVAPDVSVVVPAAGTATQDGVVLAAVAIDNDSGISDVWFTLREDDGADGVPIGWEHLDAAFDAATETWTHGFDTTQVPDGYYLITATAEDGAANRTRSEAVAFSVRNWAVVELLPATPRHNAGRTVPVKFSISVVGTVDPAMPFVHNEQLVIRIYETGAPDEMLHEAIFGSGARDYRIEDSAEMYITNFKTLRRPSEYTVLIIRGDLEIGRFGFITVRGRP